MSSYRVELQRMLKRPSLNLTALLKLWPSAQKQMASHRSQLLDRISKHDPIRSQIDFLGSLKRTFDETLHTQALAYALSPVNAHGFGNRVLLSLLEYIHQEHPRSGAARVLKSLRKPRTRIFVRAEYRYQIEGMRDRSTARSDIWVEGHARKRSALVVIENKIHALESEGQLSWYERKAREWCKAGGHTRQLLIFLSKHGDDAKTKGNSKWVSLSYIQLAAALRLAWDSSKDAEGSEWLALYIASITRGVLGIDLDQPTSFAPKQLETYLHGRS